MTNEELVARVKAGIDTAENMLLLYQQNSGMIYTIARKYAGLAELDDLLQEGYIALCAAVDGYEPENGVLFSSYAWKAISKQLQRYIYGECNLPEYMQRLTGQYRQLTNAFLVRYGCKPTRGEFRRYLGVTQAQLKEIEKSLCMEQIESLDRPIGEDGEATLCDTLKGAENVESSVLDEVQQEQLKTAIWGAVDGLPGNQQEVVRKRYQEGMTLEQISAGIGSTWQNVQRIEAAAFRNLRCNPRLQSFAEIYGSAIHGTGKRAFNRTWTSATERVAIKRLEQVLQEQEAWERKHGSRRASRLYSKA